MVHYKVFVSMLLLLLGMTGPLLGQVIDFSGINGVNVADGNGQSFSWSSGAITGMVVLSADWTNLPDQGGPIRTATAAGATLASPFVGTLTISFSQPVQINLSATFSSLLNDGIDGGRFERVVLSTVGPVTFAPGPGTTAIYSGQGTQSITADDMFSDSPTTSIWGFVGSGLADHYTFVYTSTRTGFSETFNVVITQVPEPCPFGLLSIGLMGLIAIRREQPRKHSAQNS